ncbi:isopenicillin N synthase family dioxygenase [Nesterenkonia flava]|uniref:2-oxoglutarate and iron-dependent oxygenase domain-containing protein n=1 Tax=Nesterenkonia flava TaxID=469799 RepID=A0ABU1FV05_9MICC|nr:2-oxoglutarate and iron-dependent oxygenase domain-containing protein [Nesterenkonia flava]MDR5712506.1 2-oxoglutarate and iron-dependent oxygenase domain-containing protein [Nesterenkonia flava]
MDSSSQTPASLHHASSHQAPFSVPVVDIAAYVTGGSPEEKAEAAAALDHACRTVGFIQITGHGIPAERFAGLMQAMDDFFAGPLEAKKEYKRPAKENRGYSPPKTESLSFSLGVDPVSRMNDFFEAYNVGAGASDYEGFTPSTGDYAENTWPVTEGFREKVEAYFAEARRVALNLQDAFADALGVEQELFRAKSQHPINVLRMNNYALPPGEIELGAELTGMGEHTDFGFVTVLWADQVEGLQVLDTQGRWHDVMPADNALLVNLGDIAARVTNDQWMSTLHRVKPPVVNGQIKRRRSAAFFHDWDADAVIETLPGTVEASSAPLYEPVTVHEHIRAKLAGSRAGIKNTSAVREQARVQAAL